MTGATTGSSSSGSNVSRSRRPGGEHAVEGTGGRQPDGRGQRRPGPAARATPCTLDAVEHHHADAEHDLEGEQLRRDRRGLAEEDRAAVEARRGAARRGRRGAVSIANGAPDASRCGEQHRDPEQAGRDAGAACRGRGRGRTRTAAARSARTGGSGPSVDPGAGLDPQVLARDQRGLAPDHGVTAARLTAPARRRGSPGRDAGRRRHGPRGSASGAGELELVRRHQHRAALGRRRARRRRRAPPGPSASSPAWGSSSSSRLGLARPARPRARGGGAARRTGGGAPPRPAASSAEPLERGVGVAASSWPDGPGRRTEVLRAR